MSLDPRSWRPSPLLPPARGVGVAALCLATALLSLTAVLAMIWLSADLRARSAIGGRLSGGATIAIGTPRTAGGLESLDAAAWRAREILAATPSVASAQVLTPAPADGPIAAAMGMGGAPARLIALGLKPAGPPVTATLVGALAREGLTAAADDHNPATGPVERALALNAAGLSLAGALIMLILASLTASVVHGRAGRVAARMSLLSDLGMTDTALLARLLRPITLSVSLASIGGGAAALAITGLWAPRPPGLAPLIPAPGAVDLLLAAAWPALAVVVTLLVSVMTGLARIRRITP